LEAFNDEVVDWWIKHHELPAGIDNFEKSFTAIVQFDISECTNYTFQPMKFNEVAYYQKWNATKLKILQENLELGMKNLNLLTNSSSSPTCAQHSSVIHVKPHKRKPFLEGRGSSTWLNVCFIISKTFWVSKAVKSDQDTFGHAFILLMICTCPGHRANNCTKTTLEKGGDIACAWWEGKLTGVSFKKAICIRWNLSASAK
jgi:hypothetical protein